MHSKRIVIAAIALVALGSVLGVVAGRTSGQTKQMPPGHPPMGGQGGGPSIPPPPAQSGTGAQSLTWTAPAGWTKENPTSSMRRAQYKIAGPGGPAECVVFYFGPGQGGDTKANVDRWVSQFRGADGKPVANSKMKELKVGDIAVTTVEVAGTYVGGMGGPSGPDQPDYMLLGAIADGPDAKWFFRATGPKATLEPQKAAFDKMIHSIKRGSQGA